MMNSCVSFVKKRIILFSLFVLPFSSFSQNAWNATNFIISKDTASLEPMSDAVALAFSGSPAVTNLHTFPGGFVFKYGDSSYTGFSASDNKFIRLGAKIQTSNFFSEPNVIGVFCYGFMLNLQSSWKMVTSSTGRKIVIEWAGRFTGTDQDVRVQLWLHERTGKIEAVYSGNNAFGATANSYHIFCHTTIAGQNAIASINILNDGNGTPQAVYGSPPSNHSFVPANTKYTFAPDTVAPVRPGISVSSLQPGCFTISVKDSSTNEARFVLQKMKSPGVFVSLSQFNSTDIPGTGTLYSTAESNLQPDSLYTYRVYASNSFVNSDTIVFSVRTPMPLLSGIVRVPGDYPSMNNVFSDALCKGISGQLIIELQTGYSFAAENGPVLITQPLRNRFIQSIIIRPAAAVTDMVLANSASTMMIAVDSINFVDIDGRPGGQGTTGVLTFRQTTGSLPVISYTNGAGYGKIQYLKIEASNLSAYGAVYLGMKRPGTNTNYTLGVANNMLVSNCKFGPQSGTSSLQVVEYSGINNVIRDNEFFRFSGCAVSCSASTNCKIVHNRFYRPEPVSNTGSNGVIDGADVLENFTVDSNRIGGSAAAWGQGLWEQGLTTNVNCESGLIKVKSGITSGRDFMCYIRNNEFGNIKITGNCTFSNILAQGSFYITGNRIGTSDSAGSISSEYTQSAIYAKLGRRVFVENNFVSGLKASSFATVSAISMDTVIVRNNDLGGADKYSANLSTGGTATGVSITSTAYGLVRNNNIRGFYSATGSVTGISTSLGLPSVKERSANIDSNIIHHMDGRRVITGISLRAATYLDNTIIDNKMYALNGRGPADGSATSTKFTGIDLQYFSLDALGDSGISVISGNRMYSFDYTTTQYVYYYPMTGIKADGHNVRINNNFISLGINSRGLPSDSIELQCTGIYINRSAKPAYIEHNSIFLGGRGNGDRGISFTTENFSNGLKNIFLTNNILSLNRRRYSLGDNKYYVPYNGTNFNNVVANNNIWHSEDDTAINTKLQLWRSVCKCDSLSFIANPQFINPYGDSINNNLHLQNGSSADAAGTPPVTTIPNDVDGEARYMFTPHDIGADAATPCAAAVSASISLSTEKEKLEFCAGLPVTLTGIPDGPITNLQWQKNLYDIAGANTSQLAISEPGSYRLVGQTACGLVASRSVTVVKGITQATATLTPANGTTSFCDGGTATLKVNYSTNNDYPVEFVWYKNNVVVPGKISALETIDNIHSSDVIRVQVKQLTPCGIFTTTLDYTLPNVSTSERPRISILSFRDSLFSTINRDTVTYSVTNSAGYRPQVIYVTPVDSALHAYLPDGSILFTNLPYTIKFRLHLSRGGLVNCFYPDTTDVKTIYVSNTQNRVQYIFNGNGNWTVPSNWIDNSIPPSHLPFNAEIIISPAVNGTCILNIQQWISPRAKITVNPNARFIIQGELRQE